MGVRAVTGILLDLAYQLASLAAVTCGTLAVLLVAHLGREAWLETRALLRERRACDRIDQQRALGLRERITGDVIAERRR